MVEKNRREMDSMEEEILQSVEEEDRAEEREEEDYDEEDYEEYEDGLEIQEIEPAVYEIETRIGKKDLFQYLLMHNYGSVTGKVSICLSVLALIMLLFGAGRGDMLKTGLLLAVGALYTVINPILLYLKAIRQAKLNPAYKNIMKFGFHEKGMNISVGEQEGMIGWNKIQKVKRNKKIWAFYTSPIHASLIPTRDLKKDGDKIADYIEEHIKGVLK